MGRPQKLTAFFREKKTWYKSTQTHKTPSLNVRKLSISKISASRHAGGEDLSSSTTKR